MLLGVEAATGREPRDACHGRARTRLFRVMIVLAVLVFLLILRNDILRAPGLRFSVGPCTDAVTAFRP